MFPSEQCCFMVGTSLLEGLQDVQRESLWPEGSIKTIGVKESSKKGGKGIEVPPKLRGGIRDTNILILDTPSTPSKVRTDLISLSAFCRLST